MNPSLTRETRSRKRRTAVLGTLLLHAILIACALATLAPFAWLVCATFKTKADFFTYTFLPWDHLSYRVHDGVETGLTFDNYRRLFAQEPFAVWMLNSLFLASTYTAVVVTLSSLGGFALAKYRFPGRKVLMLIMLVTMLVPSQVLLLPNYDLMRKWGWMNSYAAILVPSAVSVFGMFLFRQAMLGVPDELLQAGRMDGCSEFRLWWEVALPIVRPMTGAYTLLSFMTAWNSFLWPQVVLQTPDKLTLPIGLSNMINLPEYQTHLGILMAGTLLSILPVAVLFFILQRDFVAGLASGAVKG